jgi:imidazolonepropionase
MKNAVLIHGARQLITLRGPSGPRRGIALGELGIIQDGALLVVDGRIEAVGQGRRVENLAAARGAVEIDATRRIVLPGFVDSHTHLVSGHPVRSEFESHDVAHTGGVLHASVRDLRLTPSRTLEGRARLLLEAFIRHGTTTLEAKTGYGLDRRGEMKTLRVLAKLAGSPLDVIPTYLGAGAVPPEFEGRGHEYIDWVLAEMLPHIARRELARFAGVRCGKGAFSLEDARRYLEAARRLGLGLKVHADQFAHTGAVRLAVELGAISAGHLEHAGEDDVSILAQSSTIATLVPGTAFYLDLKQHAPARALIGHGAAVALATGFNPDTSPTCSMPMVVALACSQLRMTPAEAVSAATINGAHALGCADRVGSLEAGKQADLIMLDVPDYRDIPCHFGENLVALTMKRGVVLYKRAEVQCP